MNQRLNEVVLIGKLLGTPEPPRVYKGKPKLSFTLMVPGAGDKNLETTFYDNGFFDVECWNEIAEFVAGLKDKSLIKVSGSLRQHKWKDATSGTGRDKKYISGLNVELVETDNIPSTPDKSKADTTERKPGTKKAVAVPSNAEDYDPFVDAPY